MLDSRRSKKVLLSWSSGKDSYWALRLLRKQPNVEVVALLTMFNSAFDRVAMHAVRRELVAAQARSLSLPLWSVELPWPCPNHTYECQMSSICDRASTAGISSIAFGDLFLRDIREYRERQLRNTGLEPLFPLWELATEQLAADMIAGGTRAVHRSRHEPGFICLIASSCASSSLHFFRCFLVSMGAFRSR